MKKQAKKAVHHVSCVEDGNVGKEPQEMRHTTSLQQTGRVGTDRSFLFGIISEIALETRKGKNTAHDTSVVGE